MTADFVVVGGGFAGLSAARRLTQLQPGARIVVLEAGRIAEGAAGRNSGFMIDLPHDLASEDYAGAGDDRVMIGLNRQAIAFARAAARSLPASLTVRLFCACNLPLLACVSPAPALSIAAQDIHRGIP